MGGKDQATAGPKVTTRPKFGLEVIPSTHFKPWPRKKGPPSKQAGRGSSGGRVTPFYTIFRAERGNGPKFFPLYWGRGNIKTPGTPRGTLLGALSGLCYYIRRLSTFPLIFSSYFWRLNKRHQGGLSPLSKQTLWCVPHQRGVGGHNLSLYTAARGVFSPLFEKTTLF